MFNLVNLRFTGGGIQGNDPVIASNLSTLTRVGGGRLNERKSDEGYCRECREFQEYSNLRNTISIRYINIQPSVRACDGSKYRQLYVSNFYNQGGRNINFSLCDPFNKWDNTSVAGACFYDNGSKFSDEQGFSWFSLFSTTRSVRSNQSNSVCLTRNEVVA